MNFDAPIPGQSLTMPKGSLAMERPPQFVDLEKALDYLFDQLTQPKQTAKLLMMLKDGMPVEAIVRTILFAGVTSGKWTPDLTIMMAQVVTWQIEAIAKLKGVEYTLKNHDTSYDDFMSGFTNLLDNSKEQKEIAKELKFDVFKGLNINE